MQDGDRAILIVDGDQDVRSSATEALGPLGHKIVAAADADTALTAIEEDGAIALMLVDVTLEGARQLVARAQAARPGLHVVYTTGYPEMLILDREAPSRELLLRKPLDPERIRAVMARVTS